MNTYTKKWIILVSIGIAVSGITAYAFTTPTQVPSGGNAEPVLNVGDIDQIKTGPFGIGQVVSSDFFSIYGATNALRVDGPSSIEGNTAIQVPANSVGSAPNWVRNKTHTLTTNGQITATALQNSVLQTSSTATVRFIQLANPAAATGTQSPVCVKKGSAGASYLDGVLVSCPDMAAVSTAPPSVSLTAQYPQGLNVYVPITARLSWTSSRATECFQIAGPKFNVPTGLSGRTGSNVLSGEFSDSVKFTIGCVNGLGQLATDSVDVLLGYPAPTADIFGNFEYILNQLKYSLNFVATKPAGATIMQCRTSWRADTGAPACSGSSCPWSQTSSSQWTAWSTVSSPFTKQAEIYCYELFSTADCVPGGTAPVATFSAECRGYDGGATFSQIVGDSFTAVFQ